MNVGRGVGSVAFLEFVLGKSMMKKSNAAADPSEYLSSLSGWRRGLAGDLRSAVLSADDRLEEAVKWGHLVYSFNGPVLLIRAEDDRVLFGFWRGQRLLDIEPALKPSGQYEMATVVFHEADDIDLATAKQLAAEAAALNDTLGDPRKAAKNKN